MYFLIVLIVIYSLGNLQWYLEDIKLITLNQLYSYYYFPISNLIPALLYFYVIFYLYPERAFKPKEKLLFIPFLISLSLSLLYKVLVNIRNNEFTDGLRLYLSSYDELLSAIFHIVILFLLIRMVNKYEKQEQFAPNGFILYIKWLKVTLTIMFVLTLLWIGLNILYVYFPGQISFYPLWIAIAIIIYWLGHIGIYKYGIVEERKHIRKKRKSTVASTKQRSPKHLIIERLKDFLENEKRFLDASLTLEKTAESLALSQGHLSKIINTELGISFKDYINALRVEEAKTYLLDQEFSNYTLVAIGLEAGFNSKSAFNASFKKISGETPSQFKQRHFN
ncbi:helix-turn-helix domain-containing protein [Lacinutrix chionoecetis]